MRSTLSACAAFGALVLAGCDWSTAPTQLRVTLTGPQVIQGSAILVDSVMVYSCNYPLTATGAGGSNGEVATWVSAYWSSSQKDTAYAIDPGLLFPDNPDLISGTSTTVDEVASLPLGLGQSTFRYSVSLYYSTPQNSYLSTSYTFVCE